MWAHGIPPLIFWALLTFQVEPIAEKLNFYPPDHTFKRFPFTIFSFSLFFYMCTYGPPGLSRIGLPAVKMGENCYIYIHSKQHTVARQYIVLSVNILNICQIKACYPPFWTLFGCQVREQVVFVDLPASFLTFQFEGTGVLGLQMKRRLFFTGAELVWMCMVTVGENILFQQLLTSGVDLASSHLELVQICVWKARTLQGLPIPHWILRLWISLT